MVGLLDIAKVEEGEVTVKVKGQDLSIKGLSSREIKKLIRLFPALDQAMGGDPSAAGKSIAEAVPGAMVEIALMGTFHENDEKREEAREAFEDLKLHEQLNILNAIMEQTLGDYWNPLLEKAKAWVAKAADVGDNVPAQNAPGTVPPTELLRQLRSSLRSKTTEEDLFGTSPPGNSQGTPN